MVKLILHAWNLAALLKLSSHLPECTRLSSLLGGIMLHANPSGCGICHDNYVVSLITTHMCDAQTNATDREDL